MKFKKNQSGNPSGRPKGIADRRSAYKDLLEPHAPALISRAVDLALGGDVQALRLCIERIFPAKKTQDEPVNLGPFDGSLADCGRAVLSAVADGRITPDEAATLMSAVVAQGRVLEIDEIERRIVALEAMTTA